MIINETHNPWTILSRREIYDNKWIGLTEYDVLNPSGGKGIYGKVHFKNIAIGIIPIDEDGNIYLIGQYRFAIDQYSWEIPEGGGPLGEDTLVSAKRELLEEAGLQAKKWTKLMDIHLSNSVCDETGVIYLAQELSQHAPMPEDTEQLMVRKVPFEEAYQMVVDGRITDALAIAAILKVKVMMLEDQIFFL